MSREQPNLNAKLNKWRHGRVTLTPEEIEKRLEKGLIVDADQISERLTEESREAASQRAIESLRRRLDKIN